MNLEDILIAIKIKNKMTQEDFDRHAEYCKWKELYIPYIKDIPIEAMYNNFLATEHEKYKSLVVEYCPKEPLKRMLIFSDEEKKIPIAFIQKINFKLPNNK